MHEYNVRFYYGIDQRINKTVVAENTAAALLKASNDLGDWCTSPGFSVTVEFLGDSPSLVSQYESLTLDERLFVKEKPKKDKEDFFANKPALNALKTKFNPSPELLRSCLLELCRHLRKTN